MAGTIPWQNKQKKRGIQSPEKEISDSGNQKQAGDQIQTKGNQYVFR